MAPAVLMLVLVAAAVAILLDRRLQVREPSSRSYRWGYFQGVSGILMGGLGFVGVMLMGNADGASGPMFAGGAMALIWFVAGVGVAARRRWAWWVHTILSLNPIWWVVNPIYAKRRWSEMGTERMRLHMGSPSRQGSVTPRTMHGSGSIARVSVIAAAGLIVVVILLTMFALVPQSVAHDTQSTMRRVDSFNVEIAKYTAVIDSIERERGALLPRDAALLRDPSVRAYVESPFVRERLASMRQSSEFANTMIGFNEANARRELAALERRTEERLARRQWFLVASGIITLCCASAIWVLIGQRARPVKSTTRASNSAVQPTGEQFRGPEGVE